MNRLIETENAPPPFSRYAQGMEIPAGSRLVFVSGQVGIDSDGVVPDDFVQQHEIAWANVFAILEGGSMGKGDIVDILAIVTDHEQVPIYREVRDRMLDGHVCCSTMLVCGLANPDWKVEIAVTAAKA